METVNRYIQRFMSAAYVLIFFSVILSIPAATSEVKEYESASNDAERENSFRIQLELYTLNNLIAQNSDNADYYYSRGWIFEQMGDPMNAEKDYSSAIKINADYSDAFYNRGLLYLKDGKYELAIKDFSEVLRINPASADAFCNRGNAYLAMEKPKKALQDFTAAIQLDPQDPDLYYNRALIYLKTGKKKKAMEDMREAARLGNLQAREYLDKSGSIL